MSNALPAIDHELMGLRAKLHWDHLAPHTIEVIKARITELETKRAQIVAGQSA